jgi:hypothetical protein
MRKLILPLLRGPGTNDVNWLKVLVDPTDREVFAFQPQIVPANKVPHPAIG